METENISRETAIDQMIDISSHPVLFKYFNFGKYKNQSIEEVARDDKGYIRMASHSKDKIPMTKKIGFYTLESVLK